MLYKFQNLRERLDNLGFPNIDPGTPYQAIRTNFEEAHKEGYVTFEDDGIILEHNGKKYRGYMYIREAYVTYNGDPPKFPKFHLKKCAVIKEFIDIGRFDDRFEWSNHQMNDITDKQTKKIYKDKVLSLCSNCRSLIEESIDTTGDFFKTLNARERDEAIEIDIFGYTRDWAAISKAYRKKVNYTCESCSLHIENKFDQRYLHTHHRNGDKTMNADNNLECLCVLCHCYKDSVHEKNFERRRMKSELTVFVNKYRDRLIQLNNPFLTQLSIPAQKSQIRRRVT